MNDIVKHSGLQKQVLSLYRRAVRTARLKSDGQRSLMAIRDAFKAQKNVDRRDFRLVEFLIRQGERKIKVLSNDNVRTFNVMQASRKHTQKK